MSPECEKYSSIFRILHVAKKRQRNISINTIPPNKISSAYVDPCCWPRRVFL